MTRSDSPSQPTPMIHGRLFLHSPDGKALGGVPISFETNSDAHTVTNELGEFSLPTSGLRPGHWARFKLDLEGADLVPLHPYMLNVLVPAPHAATEPVILLVAAPDDCEQYASAWFIPRANAALEARLRRDFPDDPTLFEVPIDGRNRAGKGTYAMRNLEGFARSFLWTAEPESSRCRAAEYLAFTGEFDLALRFLPPSALVTVATLPSDSPREERELRAREWLTRAQILDCLARTEEAFECQIHADVLAPRDEYTWTIFYSRGPADAVNEETVARFIDRARREWAPAELALLLVWHDLLTNSKGDRTALLEALDLLRSLAEEDPAIWLPVLIEVLVNCASELAEGAAGERALRWLDEAEARLRPLVGASSSNWHYLYIKCLDQRAENLEVAERLDEARPVLLELLALHRSAGTTIDEYEVRRRFDILERLSALELRAGNADLADAYAQEAFADLLKRDPAGCYNFEQTVRDTMSCAKRCVEASRASDGIVAFDQMITRHQMALQDVPMSNLDPERADDVTRTCSETIVALLFAKSRFQLDMCNVDTALLTCDQGLAKGLEYLSINPAFSMEITSQLADIGPWLRNLGRLEQAWQYHLKRVALHREHLAYCRTLEEKRYRDYQVAFSSASLASALHESAEQLRDNDRLHEAQTAIDEAVQLMRLAYGRTLAVEPYDIARHLATQAFILIAVGNPEAAAASLREAMVHCENDQYHDAEFLQSRREELQARLDELSAD